MTVTRYTSHHAQFTRQTSQIPPHTSHLTPHTSHLTSQTAHLTPITPHISSHLIPHTSHTITHHTSHFTHHTSHVFASHITHHSSRFTRHTNAAALLLLNGGCVSCSSSAPPEENIIIIMRRRNSGAVAVESVVASPFLTCFHMKFSCRNPDQKITRHTLERGDQGDTQGSGSPRTVAEHEVMTSQRMRIGNFNVAGIARSNFEPGVNINQSLAILHQIAPIDVVSVCDRVNISVVGLRGVRGKRQQASAWNLTTCLLGAA